MKKLLLVLIILALVAGCSSSTAKTPTPAATPSAKKASASGGASAQGYVTPVRHADLSFRTGGRVAEVLVKEGDQVKAGQPLVKLQDAELKAALAAAQAELKRLQAGSRQEEIAAAQADLEVANGQVKAAQTDLDKVKTGAQQAADLASAQAQLAQAEVQLKNTKDTYDSVVSGRDTCKQYGVPCGGLGLQIEQLRVQLAAAQAGYDAARARVGQVYTSKNDDLRSAEAKLNTTIGQRDAAQAKLNLLKAGSMPEEIDAAKARADQAQAALDETVLLAPFDGTITEMIFHVGELVSPGPRVASIADLSQWEVDTDDLSEVDVVNVQPGAVASVKVDALPDVALKGQVKSIVPRSIVKRGDVTYTVKVVITNPDPRLKWGMTAFVDIQK
jgi:multidrug resistance efflux pump